MKIKKKHVLITAPIVVILLLASFVFFYGMSRNYEEPEDTVEGVGLSDIMAKPESGTPADYTPQENAAIALGVIRDIGKYKTEMSGDIDANIGFMNYVQNMKDTKIINGDEMYQESISLSSMANVAQQKYIQDQNKIYLVRSADQISGQTVTWSNEITPISEETYTNTYGLLPNGISPYVVSKKTILSAQTVEQSDNRFVYTYQLDPETAPAYYRRQVKTLSGSQKNPLFHSVTLTIEMDQDWKPLKVIMQENYDISIPVMGSANCTTEFTEIYQDYGQEQQIPDKELYEAYIRDKYDPNNLSTLDGSGKMDMKSYLGKVFGADEQGIFHLEADLSVNSSFYKMYVQGDLQTDTYQIQLGDIYACLKDDKLYFDYANLKYHLTVDGLMDALQDVAYVAGFEIPELDADSMNSFMNDMTFQIKDGMQEMTMNLDGVDLMVHLENSTMKLIDANINGYIGGMQFQALVKPTSTPHMFPGITGNYENMLPLLEYVNPIFHLINADSWEFDTTFTLTGQPTLTQNAYVKMMRTARGVNVQIDTNILDQHLTVRLVNGIAYIDYGNLKLSFHTDSISQVSSELQKILPAVAGTFSLTDILPDDYIHLFANPDISNIMKNMLPVRVKGNTVFLGLRLGNHTIRLTAIKKGQIMTNFQIEGVSIRNAALSADVRLTALNRPGISIATSGVGYTRLEDVLTYLDPLMNLLQGKTINLTATVMLRGEMNYNQDIEILLTKNGNRYDASLSANVLGTQIKLQFINQVVYVDTDNIHLRLETTNIREIAQELGKFLPINGRFPDIGSLFPQEYVDLITNFDVSNLLQSIQRLDIGSNPSKMSLAIGKNGLRLELGRSGNQINYAGLYHLPVQNHDVSIQFHLHQVSAQQTYLSVNESLYTDVAHLAEFVEPIQNTMNASSYVFDVNFDLQGQNSLEQKATVTVVKRDNTVHAEVVADVFGNPFSLKWIDEKAYIQYGAVKVSADQYDIGDVLDRVLPVELPRGFTDIFANGNVTSVLKVFSAIQSVSADENSASIGVKLNDQEFSLALGRNDEFVTSGRLEGLQIADSRANITIRALHITSEQLPITVNTKAYTTVDDMLPTLRALRNTLEASSYQFDAQIKLSGQENLTQNAKIKLTRTANGIDAEVKTMLMNELVSLKYINGVTYLQYGNIKLRLHMTDMDGIIQEIKEVLPPEMVNFDITAILPQSYIDAFKNLGFEEMVGILQSGDISIKGLEPMFACIGQIETLDLDSRGVNFLMRFGGDTIALQLDREYDYITRASIKGVTLQNSSVECVLENGVINSRVLPIGLEQGQYIDVNDAIQFIEPIQNLLKANSYDFDVNLHLKGDMQFKQKANVKLVRDGSHIKAVISTKLYGDILTVTYIDGMTYLSYGNLKCKVEANDIDEIKQKLTELLPFNQESLNLDNLIPQAYIEYFSSEWTFSKILDAIQRVDTDDIAVYADLQIGTDTVSVTAKKDGADISDVTVTGVTVADGKLDIQASMNSISADVWDITVDDDTYFAVSEILPVLDVTQNAFNANSYEFDVRVDMTGEQAFSEMAKVRLVRSGDGVKAEVRVQLEGETLLLTQQNGAVYISYGNLRVKLHHTDIENVLKTLKDILPKQMLEMNLSALLPQTYIDTWNNLQLHTFVQNMQTGNINQTTAEPVFKLLQMIESITADGTSTAITVKVGDDLIPIRAVYDGVSFTEISVENIAAGNSRLRVEIKPIQITADYLPLTELNEKEFTDVKQIVDFVPAIANTINANRYAFTTKVQLGEDTIDAHVTIVKNGIGFDAQVTTMIGGAQLMVQYIDQIVYVQYGNIKLQLHQADLQTVIDEVQAVLSDDIPEFEIGSILPQAYIDEIEALGIGQLIANMQAGNINRATIAPLLKVMQKITVGAQEQQLTMSAVFAGEQIELVTTSKNNLLATAEISGITAMEKPTVLYAEMTQVDGNIADISNNSEEFVNAEEAVGFVKPITQLMKANTIEFTVNGIANGKFNGELQNAVVRIQRTDNGVNGEVVVNDVYGHSLLVKLVDNVTYVDYANIKLRLNLSDIHEIADEIRAILPEEINSFDLTTFIPQSYLDIFQNADMFELVQKFDHVTVSGEQITFDFHISDTDVLHATVRKDADEKLSVQVNGLDIYESDVSVDATVVSIDHAISIAPQGEYADTKQIAYFTRPIMDIANANSLNFDANITFGDMFTDQTAHVKLLLHRDGQGAVQSVDSYATTEIDGRTLTIKMFGSKTYMQYGDIRIMLDTKDIEAILTRLRDILPEGTLDENADLSAMIPIAYTDLLGSFANGAELFEKLIGGISHVSVNNADLHANLQIGDDIVKLKLNRNGSVLTGGSVHGITVAGSQSSVVISNITMESVTIDPITDSANYINAADLVDFVEAGMNSYEQLNNQIFDVKADLKINGHEVKMVIINNHLYLYYHDTNQFKVGGAPYTGIKMQMDYNAMLDLTVTGVDLMEIPLPEDVKVHILGSRVPLDTSVLNALPIPTVDELLADNHVNVNINLFALVKNIQCQGDTFVVTLNSKELFGDAAMPDTIVTVSKADNGTQQVISKVAVTNTNNQDTTVAIPSDANNYMDFSSLNTFADSLMQTADLKEYRITGDISANMRIIGINFNASIPMDFRLRLNEDHTVQKAFIELNVPYYFMVLQQNMVVRVYYEDGILYFDRSWETSSGALWWKEYYDHHEYMKCTIDEFMADPMKYIYFCTNFTSIVQGAIDDAIANSDQKAVRTGNPVFEESLTGFTFNGVNLWHLTLDAAHLFNNSDFADNMLIMLARGDNGLLNQISFSTQVLNLINLQLLNGHLINADKSNVDMSVVPGNLSEDTNYIFGQVHSVDYKK